MLVVASMKRRAFLRWLGLAPLVGPVVVKALSATPARPDVLRVPQYWEKEMDYGYRFVQAVAIPRPGREPWVWAREIAAPLTERRAHYAVRVNARDTARMLFEAGRQPAGAVNLFERYIGHPVLSPDGTPHILLNKPRR